MKRSVAFLLICFMTFFTVSSTVFAVQSNQVIQEENQQKQENLVRENEYGKQQAKVNTSFTSDVYTISDDLSYIGRILPETQVSQFKKNFSTDATQIHVFDANGKKEITSGLIGSNMLVRIEGIATSYRASVIADFNGDGKAGQIELNRMIRHAIGLEGAELTGIEILSADISGDDKIDQVDINLLIRYIVYGQLDIGEMKTPVAPTIKVTGGQEGENEWYTSEVTIQITETTGQPMKIAKTVYEITGPQNKNETEFTSKEEVILQEEGTYVISAYTIAENGIRSSARTLEVKIDQTAPESANLIARLQDEAGEAYTFGTTTNYSVYVLPEGGKDETSGIQELTWYATGANPVQETSGAGTIKNGGTTVVTVTTKDQAGWKTTKDFEIKIDRTIQNPGTVLMKLNDCFGENYESDTWTNQNVYLEVQTVAGCTTTYEVTGANTVAAGTKTPSTLTEEGISKVVITNTDLAGNTQAFERIVKIERKAPMAPTLNVTGAKILEESNWYTDDVQVNMTVEEEAEGSGIREIQYEVSLEEASTNGTIKNGETLSITGEGRYMVTAWAIDEAGNTSQKVSQEVWIDKTNPTAGSMKLYKGSQTGSIFINNSWSNQDIYASVVDGKDDLSGHKTTTYHVEGPVEILETTESSILTVEGTYTIIVTTTDEAGRSETRSYVVNIDKQIPDSPTIDIISGDKTDRMNEWYVTDVAVQISQGATDPGNSGISRTTYQVTGSTTVYETPIADQGTLSFTGEGIFELTVYSYDRAGNRSRETTLILKIDKTGPVIMNFAEQNVEGTKFHVTANVEENVSGMSMYEVWVDGVLYREIQSANNELDCEVIDQTSNTHTIQIQAKDIAGNITTSEVKTINMARLTLAEVEYIEFVIQDFTMTNGGNPVDEGANYVVSTSSISNEPKYLQVSSSQTGTTGILSGKIQLMRKDGKLVESLQYYPESINMAISQYCYGSGTRWEHSATINALNTNLTNENLAEGELNQASVLFETKNDDDNVFVITDQKIAGTQTYTRLIINEITSGGKRIPFKLTDGIE